MPINVDWAALKAAGVGPEEPITCRVRDAKASRLLRAVLEAAGGGRVQLDYVVENGGVTVSTRKEIERRSVVTRVYDLTDLMSSLGETKVEEGTASALGEVRTTKTPEAAAAERGAAIVKLMSDSVDAESWKAGGWGQIHLVGNTLWVRQTPENQELVAGVLATLRQAAGAHGLMVEVEMHLVTVSAEGFAKLPLPELGKGPKPAWELDDAAAGKVLAAARADAGTTLVTTPRMRLFNGQRGTLRIGQEQAYVAGIERGADGTMKPKVGTVSTGLGADIQATVSADRHYVTTTFKVVTANLLEMRAGAEEAPGLTVQVPVTWNRKLEQTVSTPDGGTLVERMPGGYVLPAGEAAGKGDEGRVVLVMVRPVIFADGKRVGDVGR